MTLFSLTAAVLIASACATDTSIATVAINSAMSGFPAGHVRVSTSASYAGDKLTLTITNTMDLVSENGLRQTDVLYWYVCAPWVQASNLVYCMKAATTDFGKVMTESKQSLEVSVFTSTALPTGNFTDYESQATKLAKLSTLTAPTILSTLKEVYTDGDFKLLKDKCVINDKKITAVMTHEFAWEKADFETGGSLNGLPAGSVKGMAGGYWKSVAYGQNLPMSSSKDIGFSFVPTESVQVSAATILTGSVASIIAIVATHF